MSRDPWHCSDGRIIRYYAGALTCTLSAIFFFWQGLRGFFAGTPEPDMLSRVFILFGMSLVASIMLALATRLRDEGRASLERQAERRERHPGHRSPW